jgi:hypothetical protein
MKFLNLHVHHFETNTEAKQLLKTVKKYVIDEQKRKQKEKEKQQKESEAESREEGKEGSKEETKE